LIHFLKAALILLATILSGCSANMLNANSIPFFYDSNFAKIAKFSSVVFTGDEKVPLFPELDRIAQEVGVSLRSVEIDEMDEDFLSKFKAALPANADKPIIIISHLYSYPDVVVLLSKRNVFVVGPTLDIDTDTVKIVGSGFDLVRTEGIESSTFENKITYIMPDNKFQRMIKDSFIEGAGNKTISVLPVNMDLSDFTLQTPSYTSNNGELVIAAYGRYFKHISNKNTKNGIMHIINYPGKPDFMDNLAKKNTEKILYYNFIQSFKTALENIKEKGVFYSFELIRQ